MACFTQRRQKGYRTAEVTLGWCMIPATLLKQMEAVNNMPTGL